MEISQATREKPNKAFVVLEEMENTGGIVFAKTNAQARRIGASRFSDGDFDSVSCRRAPYADHCVGIGGVPASLLIENGWHFECSWSGERIDLDMLDERGLYVEDVVGDQEGLVFLNSVYEAEFWLEQARRAHFAKRSTRRLQQFVLAKFPDAKLLPKARFDAGASVHCGKVILRHCRVPFDFPGQQIGPASLDYNRDRKGERKLGFRCCSGDREAFEAWAAAHKASREG